MEKLTLADKNCCQAKVKAAYRFMQLGAQPPKYVRCTVLPLYLATENDPAADGSLGQMSLCQNCAEELVKKLGPDFATLEYIKGREPPGEYFPSKAAEEESVQRNIVALKPYQHLIEKAIKFEQADGDLVLFGSRFQYITQLTKAAEGINTVVSRFSACSNGCSHCCHMATTLSTEEAKYIGVMIGVNPKTVSGGTSPEDYIDKYNGVDCPFLSEDGRCSIYAYRPFACRAYFNLSDYPALCDTKKHPKASVPSLNLMDLWVTYAMVMADSPMGDIREFFPTGINNI